MTRLRCWLLGHRWEQSVYTRIFEQGPARTFVLLRCACGKVWEP